MAPDVNSEHSQRLPELWAAADLTERRRLLLTVLDAVYVDARGSRAVVGIRPKVAFDPLFAESPVVEASFRT